MLTEQQPTELRDGRDNSSSSSEMTMAAPHKSADIPPSAASTGGGGGGAAAGGSESAGGGEAAEEKPSVEQTQWLIMSKNVAQARCKELESQLASTREELTKRDTRFAKEREGKG